MTKFYLHDVDAEVRKSNAMMESALSKGEHDSIPNSVEFNLLHLEGVAADGLPDCYDDFDDFLFDFYPGFSPHTMHEEIRLVIDSPRFAAIANRIQADWGFDMRAELEEAYAEELVA